MLVNEERIFLCKPGRETPGPVLYWMSREQRVRDNWGLLYARILAGTTRPLVVGFCLVQGFLGATLRHYDFMLRGLAQVAEGLGALGIPFVLRLGEPGQEIPRLASELGAGVVVTDFDPLRVKQVWQEQVIQGLSVPLIEVDGHNVVPARRVSDKQEYGARTIRPKIHRLASEFLEEYPELTPPAVPGPEVGLPDWEAVRRALDVDATVGPVDLAAGEDAAHAALAAFVGGRLARYAEDRNDPTKDGTSRLSAYFHFGQLAPQRAALVAAGPGEGSLAFLEESVVRRELAENFCLHNPRYDSLEGAPDWALKTLDAHRGDPRPYLYTPEQFELAATHSRLWNAAQTQLRLSGYMHGYMRMFWAKKILEWSATPEEAHATVVRLNDRYQLDGRDPNGYVGALWSVAGLHDRPWKQRPVYGSIRYMNENGCRRKFRADAYIATWER